MAFTREQVRDEVLAILKPHVQSGIDLSEASHLVADLGIDSLGVMEVVADLEDKFKLTIPASRYTPVDGNLIPTGELRAVAGGPFDFTKGKAVSIGLRDGKDQQIVYGRGFDHNFALDKGQTKTPELSARLEDPVSGRVLEVLSTEPGVQFYSGNFLDGTLVGKEGHLYRMGDGIALEPQKFPDGPNHPDFPSTRVDPGKPYRHVMIYRVTTSPR